MTRLSSSRMTSDTLHPRSAAAAVRAWRDDAACRGAPLAVFYPPEGRGPKPRDQYRAARGYCSQCPVIRQCEADALVTDRVFGAHGYRALMAPDERARLVRR